MSNIPASIIIVNWNTRELTDACLRSINEKIKSPVEVIVVDNASTDGSGDFIENHYPNVILVRNSANLGYSRANNQGIKLAKSDLIILMNSDTEVLSVDPVTIVKAFFTANTVVGIIGAKQLFPDGKVQSLGRSFVSVKTLVNTQLLFSNKLVSHKAAAPVIKVDYVDGAFLAIRRSVIDQIGLLNEEYIMYAEDMEWCWKAGLSGWQVVVLPEIEILHVHAASSKKKFSDILEYNAVNVCRFITRKDGITRGKAGFFILLLGMVIRIPISWIRRNGLGKDYIQGLFKCMKLAKNLDYVLKGIK